MILSRKNINNRIGIIYLFVFFIILALGIRLFYLQVYIYDDLKNKAEKQQKKPIPLAKKRGLIIDRNGNNLAIDTQSVSLYAYPKEYKLKKISLEEIAKKVAPIIDEDEKKVLKKISSKSFIWLKRQMPIEKLKEIKALKISGINYEFESKRIYPKKELAASLIGFTGIDNQGLTGIEHSFENVLTSHTEQNSIFLSANGLEVLRQHGDTPQTTENVKTNKVKLTLDENIQYVTEREIKKGIDKFKAERALAMTMDLQNGDILSLATYPSFDPNNYSKSKWNVIKNWAVTDFYEPGSTMKIFSICAALELGKLGINENVTCPGAIKVETWTVHDHGVSPGQVRVLKPADIIKTSSNVGTSIVSRRMKPEEHRNMLLKMGFGKPTDSKLSGEVGGIVPELPWRPSQQSAISFGQSVAVTPLQIMTAMSAIAREGVRIEPRIIKEIIGRNDKVIKTYKSKEFRTLSKDTAEKMRNLMIEVVEDKHGTGRGTKIPGYVIAGKTGTADKVENGRYRGNVISSFLGFFPADKPRILAFVVFDSPKTEHFASLTAVPVYKEIVSNVLNYLSIPPSNPEELVDKNKK